MPNRKIVVFAGGSCRALRPRAREAFKFIRISTPTRRAGFSPGAIADLLVFDPSTVNDAATYDEPDHLAQGMTHIVINGMLVCEEGTFSGALAGRVVRRGQ